MNRNLPEGWMLSPEDPIGSNKGNAVARDVLESVQRLHHVGFVVGSIELAGPAFQRSLSLQWDGRIIHDLRQQALVSFLSPATAERPLIELVQPSGPNSPVQKFLDKGGGLHHLCYEVDSLEQQLQYVRSNRDLVVREPVPAVAFNGRHIAWVYTKNRLLVEYLEAAGDAPPG